MNRPAEFGNWRGSKDLLEERGRLDESHLALLRHLTTLNATILGLLTVFCDKHPQNRCTLWLITLGALILFLSLAGGMVYIFLYYLEKLEDYKNLRAKLTRAAEKVSKRKCLHPKRSAWHSSLCLFGSCLGLLLLLASLLVEIWS